MKSAKVNDHVRFLNSAGGGVVRRVDHKTAWVETPDGFEIPTPLHECVVVDSTDTYTSGYKTPAQKKKETQAAQEAAEAKQQPDPEPTPAPAPKIKFIDRPGGDDIQVYAAFLPTDFSRFEEGLFELYLINRSNYHLNYTFASRNENGRYHLREQGVVEPDTKIFVTEFTAAELGDMEYQLFQFLPYKTAKGYDRKPPFEGSLQIDAVKFFKRHCFKQNIFFEEDALVYPIVDKPREAAPKAAAEQEAPRAKEPKNREGAIPTVLSKDDLREETPVSKPNKTPQTTVYDLHIEHLLEDSSGMTPHEILLYQVKVFDREVRKQIGNKGDKLVFIHGKGKGVLRQAIIDRLQKAFPNCSQRDASFEEYGFGAIEVTIH